MSAWVVIILVAYVIGFGAMVFRIGWPLRGSILVVLLWALVCALWPVFLPISFIIDHKHRNDA
jgi:hypothetical protein